MVKDAKKKESSEKEEVKEEKREKKEEKKRADKDLVPKKTNLGDTATIKRILDDAAINVVLNEDEMHYVEDTALSNLKLVVGFAGVGSSGVSHAYPAAFPKNWWVLLACCAFYFICSGILQLLLSFVELESILLVTGKKGSSGLNFSSHFPRFQEMYTLGVTPLPSGSLGLPFAPKFRPHVEGEKPARAEEPGCMQRSWPVNEFFDDEGNFLEEDFENVRPWQHPTLSPPCPHPAPTQPLTL